MSEAPDGARFHGAGPPGEVPLLLLSLVLARAAEPAPVPSPVGLLDAEGWPVDAVEHRGARRDLAEALVRLTDVAGGRPVLVGEGPRVLGWTLAEDGPDGAPLVGSEGGCRVQVRREPDGTWVWRPGEGCRVRVDAGVERAWAVGADLGVATGNQGAGPWVGAHLQRWQDRTYGVGVRAWGLLEVAPDQRRAAGAEVTGGLAGGAGFVEVGVGAAVLTETRTLCVRDGGCREDSRGPLVGPAVSGHVGARLWHGSGPVRRALTVGVRAGNVPGRGYSAGLVVSVARWERIRVPVPPRG